MTFTAVDEIPRDRFGRPLVVPPGGGRAVAYTRCTTFVDVLEDKYNLQQWEKRMVALGLAARRDLLLAVVASKPDDKKHLDDIAKQAKEAALASAGATIGTALHSLAERIDRGQETGPVPEEYRGDLEAYINATHGLEMLAIEQFTVLDALKIGGIPDRVARIGDRCFIADIKTGSIEFGALKIAMQLAVYSRSVPYDFLTGERDPWTIELDQDRAIVIHLPERSGTCTLHWVDIARGWEAVEIAVEVHKLRKHKDWYTTFDPLARANTLEELRALWPFYRDVLPLEQFLARKAQLEAA